jgi:hypothetical protein
VALLPCCASKATLLALEGGAALDGGGPEDVIALTLAVAEVSTPDRSGWK